MCRFATVCKARLVRPRGISSANTANPDANGKSAGRCGFCTWLGPHRYTGRSVVVDADRAALLHFESCTYEMWRNKFSKHRHMEARKKVDIDKIPFPFYRESIRLFQASRAARRGHGPRGEAREGATPRASEPHARDPLLPSAHPPTTPPRASSRPDCAAQDDPTGGKNEERWRAFFVERKIKHFDHVVRAMFPSYHPCLRPRGARAMFPSYHPCLRPHVVRSSAAARPHAPPFPSPLTLRPFLAAGDGEVPPQGLAKPGPQDQFYVTDSRRPFRETVGFTHWRAHTAARASQAVRQTLRIRYRV